MSWYWCGIIHFLDYYHIANMTYIHFYIPWIRTNIPKVFHQPVYSLWGKRTRWYQTVYQCLLILLLFSSTPSTLLKHKGMFRLNYSHKMFVILTLALIIFLHKLRLDAWKRLELYMLPSNKLVFHPLSLLSIELTLLHLFLDILIIEMAL